MKIVRLENSLVSFGFDEATGSLVEIVDKEIGRAYLNNSRHGRLFRVVAPSKLWLARYADSQNSRPEIFEAPGELTITYRSLEAQDGGLPIETVVRVVLPENSSEAVFTITIDNQGKDKIHEVRFPWVGGMNGIDGKEHDKAIAGCIPVPVYHSDEKEIFNYNLMNSHRRVFYDNIHMLLPFFDMSGKEGGISYINHSQKPRIGGIVAENLDPEPNKMAFSFSWVHMPFIEEDQMWTSPPISIGVHKGDWHATAKRFRSLADQWWRAPHTPDRLRESIGFQAIQMRTFEGKRNFMFQELPKIAENGLKYGVSDLCVWDPLAGIYLRPDEGDFWEEYDQSQTLDDLRYSLALARELGVNVSTMVNYRLIRQRSLQYLTRGEESVQRTVFGAPMSEDFTTCTSGHASFRTPYLGQTGVALCQRSAGFVKRALEITRQTMHLGFTSLFVDQAFDSNPCLSESHGHTSPDDTPEAAVDWVREAEPLVRSGSSDCYLIGENCDVFMSQYIDVSWNWEWSKCLPEVMRYTFPETLLCHVVDHQKEVLNRAFTLGCLAAFTTNMLEKTIDEYPDFAEHVHRLVNLKSKTAEYVAKGFFKDNIGLSANGAYACLYETIEHIAVVAADCEGDGGKASVSVDLEKYGRKMQKSAKIYSSDGTQADIDCSFTDGKASCSFELKPFEVCIIVLEAPLPTKIKIVDDKN